MLLALVASAVRFGCDPLLEWLIVTGGQSATGAKVELADVTSWMQSGKLELRDLIVANPTATMRNLVQAERIVLQIDPLALLHNRVVITNGAITGMELDTERSTSGELVLVDTETDEAPSALDPLVAQTSDLASDWLDDVGKRLDADFVNQLQTPQVADKLAQKWKSKADALRSRVQANSNSVASNWLRGILRN